MSRTCQRSRKSGRQVVACLTYSHLDCIIIHVKAMWNTCNYRPYVVSRHIGSFTSPVAGRIEIPLTAFSVLGEQKTGREKGNHLMVALFLE